MVKKYQPVQIDIGSNRKTLMQIRDDVINYFGFTVSTDAENVVTRTRSAYKRKQNDGLNTGTPEEVNVPRATWQAIKKATRIGSGKAVRVPTKLTNTNESIRYTIIRFPYEANTAAISKFLHAVDEAKRPDHFIMPSGAKYPVSPVTGDVNPGNEPGADPEP